MGFLLEFIRVVLLMLLAGAAAGAVIREAYACFGLDGGNGYLMAAGIYLWLFVMYRNRWQFAGWYQGRGREKLPGWLASGLIVCAIALLAAAPFVRS